MAKSAVSTANDNFGQIADWIGDLQEGANKTNNEVFNLKAQLEQLKPGDPSPNNSLPESFNFQTQFLSQKAPALVLNRQNAVMKFYLLVRQFSLKAKPWTEAIRYETKLDERFDMTLTSQRTYGYRDEFIAIQAAANLDSTEQELTEQLLILPPPLVLDNIKKVAGYRSVEAYRS